MKRTFSFYTIYFKKRISQTESRKLTRIVLVVFFSSPKKLSYFLFIEMFYKILVLQIKTLHLFIKFVFSIKTNRKFTIASWNSYCFLKIPNFSIVEKFLFVCTSFISSFSTYKRRKREFLKNRKMSFLSFFSYIPQMYPFYLFLQKWGIERRRPERPFSSSRLSHSCISIEFSNICFLYKQSFSFFFSIFKKMAISTIGVKNWSLFFHPFTSSIDRWLMEP
jgi:hypothetical protein